MSDKNSPDDSGFSDEDARNILRRAVELEKEGHVSEAKLREIAREAQIDPDALNRAMAEAIAEKHMAQQARDEPSIQIPPMARMVRPLPFASDSALNWLLVAAVLLGILAALLEL